MSTALKFSSVNGRSVIKKLQAELAKIEGDIAVTEQRREDCKRSISESAEKVIELKEKTKKAILAGLDASGFEKEIIDMGRLKDHSIFSIDVLAERIAELEKQKKDKQQSINDVFAQLLAPWLTGEIKVFDKAALVLRAQLKKFACASAMLNEIGRYDLIAAAFGDAEIYLRAVKVSPIIGFERRFFENPLSCLHFGKEFQDKLFEEIIKGGNHEE